MGGLDWLTGALAAADATYTSLGLVGEVTHEAWVGQDSYGAPQYAVAASRKARIQQGLIPHRLGGTEGDLITVRACVAFQETIPPNGAAGRHEPVDPRDRITLPLPGGLTGPIADVRDALVHPVTGAVLRSTVWLR